MAVSTHFFCKMYLLYVSSSCRKNLGNFFLVLPPETALSEGKTEKNLSNFFWRLANTYKKYILQKNWVKTVIPALSSGRSNLQRPIWGCHRQLDDRDHLVGQLTSFLIALLFPTSISDRNVDIHSQYQDFS